MAADDSSEGGELKSVECVKERDDEASAAADYRVTGSFFLFF